MTKGPNFIGIGAEKAGTTWIFINLKAHPEVCGSIPKEINFFNERYKIKKGISYYYSFFNHCKKNQIKGEYTTAYLYSELTPYLIHKFFPNIKLIVCLRNPIERAYSSYQYQIEWKGPLSIYKNFEDLIMKNQKFVERGFYYKNIKRYLRFFKKENLLILIYDDLRKDPLKFIQEIYQFLNLKNSKFVPPNLVEKRNITNTRIIKNKIPFINKFVFKYIKLTGGKIRRIENKSWLESLLDYFNLKEYLEKIINWNRKVYETRSSNVSNKNEKFNKKTRKLLEKIYKKDIEKLGKLLNKDLVNLWLNQEF